MLKNISARNAALALLLSPLTALATNGDQLLGVSAMQWSMAGAVVAAPQGAATLLINPAGIGELGSDSVWVDMGSGFLNPPRKVNGTTSDSNLFIVPAGALALNIDEQLTVGFAMAAQSGMGVDFADIAAAPGNQSYVTTRGLVRLSPGFAWKTNNDLTLGAALSLAYQNLALSTPAFNFPQNQQYGFGMSLGLVYHLNEQLQLGAAWTSKTNIRQHEFNTTAGRFSMDVDAPQSLTIGLAFRPRASWLLATDLKWINFSDTQNVIAINGPTTPGIPSALNPGWDDQLVFMLGLQKEMNAKTALRAGINYGASPIESNDVDNNLGSIAITELHLTLGATHHLTSNLGVSLAFAHAFKNDLVASSGSGNSIEIEQNILYLQLTYKD